MGRPDREIIYRKRIKSSGGQVNVAWDEEGRPIWGFNYNGQPVCYSPANQFNNPDSPRFGHYCMKLERRANGRCDHHGGSSKYGANSPAAKHLDRSKYLPKRLQESFNEALETAGSIDLRPDIALFDARINEVLASLDQDGAPVLLKKIGESFGQFDAAYKAEDITGITVALENLRSLVRQGARDYWVWQELQHLINSRTALVKGHNQLAKDAQMMMHLNDLNGLIQRIGSVFLHALYAGLSQFKVENMDAVADNIRGRAEVGMLALMGNEHQTVSTLVAGRERPTSE